MTGLRRCRGDRGSEALTVAIMFPALLAVMLMMVAAGRTSGARNEVLAAARAGARAASQARTPDEAVLRGEHAALGSLALNSARCRDGDAFVDTSLWAPGGQVSVTVTCHVQLADLGVVGDNDGHALTETAVSVIDVHRGD